MEIKNTIIATEIDDIRYYAEKLKKNETLAVKTGKYTFFITKLKRYVYTANNEAGETISEGDALRVSCDVFEVENNIESVKALEKQIHEARARMLAEDPDRFKKVTIITVRKEGDKTIYNVEKRYM